MLKKMHLNADGEVWKHCCQRWSNPKNELWIPDDNGRISIFCIEHPEAHLGFDDDLDEKI